MNASIRKPLQACLAVLLALALLATPTTTGAKEAASTKLPVLRLDYYLLPAAPLAYKLDPALNTSFSQANTLALVQANLVHLLPSGQPAPDLAIYRVSKDHLVYTFTIRKNARFSDGHEVTAADAAFSIERSLDPSSDSPVGTTYLSLIRGAPEYNAGKAKSIPGLRVLGKRTLQIRITQPVAYFLALLAYSTADVLERRVMAGKPVGKHPAFKQNYLKNTCTGNRGAGPFMFLCRDRSSNPHSFYSGRTPQYTLVPNPYYYGHKAHVEIVLPQIGNRNDSYKLYLLGKVDTTFVPSNFLKRWKGTKEYLPGPSATVDFLVPNSTSAPFNNVHCRLAVAYAIDRKTIADKIVAGSERPLYTVVPKGMLGYYDGRDNPHYSLSRARSELARCPGRTTPFTFKYLSVDVRAQAVANMLAAAHLNVKKMPLSFGDWLQAASQPLERTNTELVANGWAQDYPDPQDYCTILLHSGQQYNVGGWRNATYDRLVDRAQFALKWQVRKQLYIEAQHIALSQGAFISLSNHIRPTLLKPDVRGMALSEWTEGPLPANDDWSKVTVIGH